MTDEADLWRRLADLIPGGMTPRIQEFVRKEIDEAAQKAAEAVMDEYGILHGEAAESFVAEMERPRSQEEKGDHAARMAECDEIYRSSRARSIGERECSICYRRLANLPALLAHLTGGNECSEKLRNLWRPTE
jgi:hypothetical protein